MDSNTKTMDSFNDSLGLLPIIHKMLLIKHIGKDLIDDLFLLIIKKLIDCSYDKIWLVDTVGKINQIHIYTSQLVCGKVHVSIISKCDPVNKCKKCKQVDMLINNNISGQINFFGNSYSSCDNPNKVTRRYAPTPCDKFSFIQPFYLYDPSRILLINKTNQIQNFYWNYDHQKIYSLLDKNKYISLLDLSIFIITSNPKAFMDNFSYGIQIETQAGKTTRIICSVCTDHTKHNKCINDST